MRPLQADAILACLEQNGVRYVLTNRPKDLAALPILRQLLREIKKRG